MKRRMLSIVLLVSLSISMLTGCGNDDPLAKMSKEELIAAYNTLNADYENVCTEYDGYKSLTAGIQSETQVTAAISIVGDGTGRLTFNSVDSKIIFPSSFQYPNSKAAASNGAVHIVNNTTVTPTSNWICKMNGSTLELENSDAGISGIIKVGEQTYEFTPEELQTDVMAAWFEGLPPSKVTYSEITVNNVARGVQATTPTTIDSEDAYLRCGMIGASNMCVTYVFVYRGSQDASKDESVTNLLNTLSISGTDVIVSQN